MNRVFGTIITEDYLPFARTLFQSIWKFDKDLKCVALVVDHTGTGHIEEFDVLYIEELTEKDLVSQIQSKYSNNLNGLRWSLKSVLMIHLLKTGNYDQVFFVDPDISFYSDFSFLYESLGVSPILLSPHWGCMNPMNSELYFSRLMTDGLYNGGFLGATNQGLEVLYWWARMCIYSCKVDKNLGLYDDQRYLDLFPLICPDYKVISHRGCNVAEWNRFENKRSLTEQGKLILNGIDPLVFIHFSNLGYLIEYDPLLIPYLVDYEDRLIKNGWKGDLIGQAQRYVERNRLKSLSFFQRLMRKIVGHDRFFRLKGWGKLN